MAQWEYRKINLNEAPRTTDDIDLLNEAGNDGWELVGITMTNIAYLKRQLGEPAPAQSARGKAASSRAQQT